MEMERQNKKMQVWNLLAEKIRKLVEESVSNPEELQEIRIRNGFFRTRYTHIWLRKKILVRQWDIFVIIRSMHMKMS